MSPHVAFFVPMFPAKISAGMAEGFETRADFWANRTQDSTVNRGLTMLGSPISYNFVYLMCILGLERNLSC